MQLPFTREQFLGTFVSYNESVWPMAAILWLASVAVLLRLHLGVGRAWEPWALLSTLWLWAGFAYHAAIFTRVNPAAWLFAALFILQSGLFARACLERPERRSSNGGARLRWLGWALAAYALAYPALAAASGHRYPASPTYGVPCPTALLTAGVALLARPSFGWGTVLIPAAWSVLGSSAAFLFGVLPDLALAVAAPALVAAVAGPPRGRVGPGSL